MTQIHTRIADLVAALHAHRQRGERIVFVPTMGNLHEGHESLMRAAREHGECVVASIFVNRLQFGPAEDFDRYPRTFESDLQRLQACGVTHLFAPDEKELYPTPQHTFVEPEAFLQSTLDGEFRHGHFRGVATVVLKLFNIVAPHVAIFGRKDFQQLRVIENMVRELNLPIEIIGAPTVRADDGLALSSRNGYLNASEREAAKRLFQVLKDVAHALRDGHTDISALEAAALSRLSENNWKPQYVAVRRALDLQPVSAIQCAADGPQGLVVLGAAYIGSTRLIDNVEVTADF
ncbi:MAG: hypothetical protein RIR70_1826 [Pseudomonadota bacterium]|jgi:pantoate--beta-alanine ligase